MIFAVWIGWLPFGMNLPAGMTAAEAGIGVRIRHLILPALTLGLTGVANITLHTREKMIAIMESDYVLFARARGESSGYIVKRHALRNLEMCIRDRLLRLGDICEKYGVIVVSDEIHADFVFEGSHQVLVGLKESYRKFVVTCTAPSKTFNLAGLQDVYKRQLLCRSDMQAHRTFRGLTGSCHRY